MENLQKGPQTPREPRKFNRREILTGVGGLATMTILGCGNDEKNPPTITINTPVTSAPAARTPAPTETSTPVTERQTIINGPDGMTLYVDKDDIATKYTLKSGEKVTTTPIDRTKALTVQEAAKRNQEPEILEIIRYDKKEEVPPSSAEHFARKTLPKDIVPEAEMAKRGVRIIQASNTSLSIREAAFQKGGPLEQFNGTGKKLDIVLVNGPFLDPVYMKDARYDGVRNIVADDIKNTLLPTPEQFKTNETNEIKLQLEAARRQKNMRDILNLKITLNYIQKLEEPDLTEWINLNNGAAAGLCSPGDKSGGIITVFVSVGKGPRYPARNVIFSDSLGRTQFSSTTPAYSVDYRPSPTLSFPSLSQLMPRSNAATPTDKDGYVYATTFPGFTLLHELHHAEDFAKSSIGGIGGILSPITAPEKAADIGAGNFIAKGSNLWQSSKFTDDSNFFFNFSIEDALGGGYQTTKEIQQQKGPLMF